MLQQRLSELTIGEQFFLSEDSCRCSKEAIIKLDNNYLKPDSERTNFCIFNKTLIDDCAFSTGRVSHASYFISSDVYCKLRKLLDSHIVILDSMSINLQSLAGGEMYGKPIVKFGLLTIDQYNKYANIIPPVQQTCWLATPTGNTSVMCITGKGNITTNYVGCLCSVRPTICLNDNIVVYTRLDDNLPNDKITSNSFDLSMFTTEQLLQELERRKKESLV